MPKRVIKVCGAVLLVLAVLCGFWSTAYSQDSPAFERAPYLSWSGNPMTTMTIRYCTSTTDPDKIYYGIGSNLDKVVLTGKGLEKAVVLQGLTPNTGYSYRIGDAGKVYTFHTAPDKVVPFTFSVYSDSCYGSSEIKQKLFHQIKEENPAFVMTVGDIVGDGNEVSAWKEDLFDGLEDISPYYAYMAIPAGHEGAGPLFKYYFRYPNTGRYYSFVYSNMLFLGIDVTANYSPGSAQYNYIKNTLAKSQARWKVVYIHNPPYGTNHGHHSDLDVRSQLCPLFEKYRVDMVFSGHNHSYERTKPIVNDKVDLKNGVTYIVAAGGGQELYRFQSFEHLQKDEQQWVGVRERKFNHVVVSVDNRQLLLIAKDPDGNVIDRFTKTKK